MHIPLPWPVNNLKLNGYPRFSVLNNLAVAALRLWYNSSMSSARAADRLIFGLVICPCIPSVLAARSISARDSSTPAPSMMGMDILRFWCERGQKERRIGCPTKRWVRATPKRLKYLSLDRWDSPGASLEANASEAEGRRTAYLESQICVMAPGHWATVDTNCVIKEAEISLDSLQMAGPQGPRLWRLCFWERDVGHIHSCGTGVWADMEDHKRHMGDLTRCHMLYGKCPAWKQLSTTRSSWASHRSHGMPSVGQTETRSINKQGKHLRWETTYDGSGNMNGNYSKWALGSAHCINILKLLESLRAVLCSPEWSSLRKSPHGVVSGGDPPAMILECCIGEML